jgi:hypothetical protein
VTGEFVARMEDVLELYAEPLDETRPVVCLDELSKERLEFHYTPKHGSWLNMAEMEFSVLSRQCLDQRIETTAALADTLASWEASRNKAQTKINWTFRVADARKKLHWIYPL